MKAPVPIGVDQALRIMLQQKAYRLDADQVGSKWILYWSDSFEVIGAQPRRPLRIDSERLILSTDDFGYFVKVVLYVRSLRNKAAIPRKPARSEHAIKIMTAAGGRL